MLSLFFVQTFWGQSLDFEKFEYKGIKFYSSKYKIIETLGEPNRIFKPNYDCGNLSSEWQGIEYITLAYKEIQLTGNDKEKYLIENIDFANDKSLELIYGEYKLTSETKLIDLIKIFGEQVKNRVDKGQVDGKFIVQHEMRDDGIILEIENKKLVSFSYWTSC